MKYLNIRLMSAVLILWILICHYYRELFVQENKITTLVVHNKNAFPVKVYLTLGGVSRSDSSLWVQNVYGIFGIRNTGLTGEITLKPNQLLTYTPPFNKAVQGNVCFLREKINCPDGTTVVEFCFNNQRTVLNAQETCEISCVSGVSYIASVFFNGGGVWSANIEGMDTITYIQNSTIGKNSGLPGIYPFGCDDCTKSVKPPRCTIGRNEPPQKQPICNIQRNAFNGGGLIKINYVKQIN